MSGPQIHYHLLAEAVPSPDDGGTLWHFVLENEAGAAVLDAAEQEPGTPVDRLELLALVRGLEALDHPSEVTVTTPSRYVSHGLRFGLEQWRESAWQWESFGQMRPVKNADLWQRVDHALSIHRVEHRAIRPDAPHAAVPAPHFPVSRRNPDRSQPAEGVSSSRRSSMWGTVRRGVAGWLHSLGEIVAPGAIPAGQGS